MNEENNLSLVIPTYNRPKYLQRLLTYYDEQNVNFEIIIPDSSHEEMKEINKRIVSSFSHLKINHLDHFSSETNFYFKLFQTIEQINMKYCVLCADDDFIAPKAIFKSIAFLENNSDFTAVGGYFLAFLSKFTSQGNKKFYWKQYLSSFDRIKPNMSLTSSDPKTRLINHFSFYFPTFYYVHLTSFLKIIFKETLPYTKDLNFAFSFGELSLDMLTVIYGKIKTFDFFYGARESVPTQKGTSTKMLGVIKTIKDGSFDNHYSRFKNCLVKHLGQEASIDAQTSKEVVDEGMNLYIQKYITSYPYSSRIKQMIRSIRRAIYYFRINMTQYQMLSFKKQIDLRHWNYHEPPSDYYEDFMKIRNIVLKDNIEEN
ncbi:MAG: TIGR00180 family glycosyltransferase [Candidatus Hodarchaeales archaeon]